MWDCCEVRFAPDHPTASGHFPSNPIIPGALLLDAVIRAITDNATLEQSVDVRVAKFLHLVRPGDTVRIRWRSLGAGDIRFECHLLPEDTLAMTGVLDLAGVSP